MYCQAQPQATPTSIGAEFSLIPMLSSHPTRPDPTRPDPTRPDPTAGIVDFEPKFVNTKGTDHKGYGPQRVRTTKNKDHTG